MNITPPPVNVNDPALLALLSKSRKVMNKVEPTSTSSKRVTENHNTEDYDDYKPNYEESDEKDLVYKTPTLADYKQTITAPVSYTNEQVENSKLPQIIKDAMLKNRIPQAKMVGNSFEIENVKQEIKAPAKKIVNETRTTKNDDLITISRSELKELINESLVKFLVESYNKTITEAAIKKTINTLINEGKINVKKK